MSQPPRRSVLSRADLVDAIACNLRHGETRPDAGIRYLAEQLHLSWQPPAPQQTTPPPGPPPEESTPPTETEAPRILTAPLPDIPFWRLEARDFFPDAEGTERTTPSPAPYTGWRNKPQQPPRFQPLATWAELAPRLRLVLSDYREGRAIDLELTVWHISRGDVLEYFPHERRRRWGPSLLLIEDDSRHLIPYRADKRLETVKIFPPHVFCANLDWYW